MKQVMTQTSMMLLLAALIGCGDATRLEPKAVEPRVEQERIPVPPKTNAPSKAVDSNTRPSAMTDTVSVEKDVYVQQKLDQFIADLKASAAMPSAHEYSVVLAEQRELYELEWQGSTGEVKANADLRSRSQRQGRIRQIKRNALKTVLAGNPNYEIKASDIVSNHDADFDYSQMKWARENVRTMAAGSGYPLTPSEEEEYIAVNLRYHQLSNIRYKVLSRLNNEGITVSNKTLVEIKDMQEKVLKKHTEIDGRVNRRKN